MPSAINHHLVPDTLHGIRRRLGTDQTLGIDQARMKPLTRDRIVKFPGAFESLIAAVRDKALRLIGFTGSLWRSELEGLRVERLRIALSQLYPGPLILHLTRRRR